MWIPYAASFACTVHDARYRQILHGHVSDGDVGEAARRCLAVSRVHGYQKVVALVYKPKDKKETRISLRKRQDDGGGYISRRAPAPLSSLTD